MYNNRSIIVIGFTLFLCILAYLSIDKRKMKHTIKNLFSFDSSVSYEEHNEELQTNIGNPDPQDERDNNMVWEGSLYAVKYFNKEKQ